MHTQHHTQDPRALLSVLWVVLSMIIDFRDRHQFALPSFIDGMGHRFYEREITGELMKLRGINVSVLISTVPLSLVLTQSLTRPVTFIAVPVTTVTMIPPPRIERVDVYHLIPHLNAIISITALASHWTPQPDVVGAPQTIRQ